MKLSEKQANFCIFKGKKYPLNLEFSNVLKAYEILEDDVLLPFEKTQFFIYTICPKAHKIKLDKILEFAEFVVKNYINDSQKPSLTSERTVDMKQDASYIYASFKQAFDIDLHKDKISWSEFMAMFQSLPEDTKIREIMSIRARPYPKPNKHNSEEIQNLMKLKQFYALVSQGQGQTLEDGFAGLFETLKKRAVM